jgi:AcrR family transcriptional regulator
VTTEPLAATRQPLTKDRVLAAAIELADREGIDALSMRRLGQSLGVEAMALYRHVRDKDDLLDGVVEAVVAGIDLPPKDADRAKDWRADMRTLAIDSRQQMLRHPWAPPLLVRRTTVGPATLRHVDTVLGILSRAGFSIEMAHHALHVLGSRVFGFTQDPFDESTDADADPAQSAAFAAAIAPTLPHVAELAMAATHGGALGGCDDDVEFAFGLDLILDGLERQRTS